MVILYLVNNIPKSPFDNPPSEFAMCLGVLSLLCYDAYTIIRGNIQNLLMDNIQNLLLDNIQNLLMNNIQNLLLDNIQNLLLLCQHQTTSWNDDISSSHNVCFD